MDGFVKFTIISTLNLNFCLLFKCQLTQIFSLFRLFLLWKSHHSQNKEKINRRRKRLVVKVKQKPTKEQKKKLDEKLTLQCAFHHKVTLQNFLRLYFDIIILLVNEITFIHRWLFKHFLLLLFILFWTPTPQSSTPQTIIIMMTILKMNLPSSLFTLVLLLTGK